MTKLYELPNERRFIADVDKNTKICNITEPQLDILISDLNGYAEMCDTLIDNVKQAREEIKHYKHGNGNMYTCGLNKAVEILDELIESEE